MSPPSAPDTEATHTLFPSLERQVPVSEAGVLGLGRVSTRSAQAVCCIHQTTWGQQTRGGRGLCRLECLWESPCPSPLGSRARLPGRLCEPEQLIPTRASGRDGHCKPRGGGVSPTPRGLAVQTRVATRCPVLCQGRSPGSTA